MVSVPPDPDETAAMAALLKLAANPNRLAILRHLAAGERAVAELERDLDIRQPTLSQQLAELRAAGVVATRREHKSVFYSLGDARMRGLLAALDGLFGRGAPRPPAGGPGAEPLRRDGRRTEQAAVFGLAGDAA